MIKKILSIFLTVFIMNLTFLPVMAETSDKQEKNAVIGTRLVSDLNANKSKKGEIVQFISTEDYKNGKEVLIPQGTLFNGKIVSMKKSRFGFRRAKVRIEIEDMVFPNGQKYTVKGHTKRHVYKGSAIGNIAKGIICTPVALVVAVVGGVVIVIESVTIVGLLLVGPTGAVVGGTLGKLTNGVNLKLNQGKDIDLKLNILKNKEIVNKQKEQFINNNPQIEIMQNPEPVQEQVIQSPKDEETTIIPKERAINWNSENIEVQSND